MNLGQRLGWLILGGSLGTVARVALMSVVNGLWPRRAAGWAGVEWGTLCVNAVGCFLFGLIWRIAESRGPVPDELRFVVFAGFLGAFTTFSTYAFESMQLSRSGQWSGLMVVIIAHNGLGLGLAWLGFSIGRWW